MGKYKISDEPMKLREYGRNVQMMVEYAKQLEDPRERTVLSHEIVRIMSTINLNPGPQQGEDYWQKIWDHFYFLAGYEIDIDSEYPIPDKKELLTRAPKRMEYSNGRPRYRQYGRNIELMAKEAIAMDDPDRKHALVALIANIMKMNLKGSEKDSNAEITVLEHLKSLTKGELAYSPEEIRFQKFANQPPITQSSASNPVYARPVKKKKNKSKNYKRK